MRERPRPTKSFDLEKTFIFTNFYSVPPATAITKLKSVKSFRGLTHKYSISWLANHFEFIFPFYIYIMQNQQEAPTIAKSLSSSTKWIDYSDDESPPQNSDSDEEIKNQPSQDKINTNQKQYTLDEIQGPMVWLLAHIPNGDKQLSFRLKDLKKQDDQIQIFTTERQKFDFWDIQVPKTLAEKLLNKGIETLSSIAFSISNRNFQKRHEGERRERRGGGERGRGGRERGERRDREERGERGERGYRGRGGDRDRGDRGERNGQRRERGQKKRYVDKQTGKQSDNKKILEQRLNEEKDRQYTKKQSKQLAQSFGNFRNKTLEERRKEKQQQQKLKQAEKDTQKQVVPPKVDTKPKETWKRKETYEEGKSEANQAQSLKQSIQRKPSDAISAEFDDKQKKEQPENGEKKDAAEQKKVYYPKPNNRDNKGYKQGERREKIDVNEENNRLFKKFSDVRDQKQYRVQEYQTQQEKKYPQSKKSYKAAQNQASNADQEKKNDEAKRDRQEEPKNETSLKSKNSNRREPQGQNREGQRNYQNRGSRHQRGGNRKYQEKKSTNQEEKQAEAPKKETRKDNNHFSGMMSDDSDN